MRRAAAEKSTWGCSCRPANRWWTVRANTFPREPEFADELPHHPEVVRELGDKLRLPGERVREPQCHATAGAARLARHLRVYPDSDRKFLVQLLHCVERPARHQVRLQPADIRSGKAVIALR